MILLVRFKPLNKMFELGVMVYQLWSRSCILILPHTLLKTEERFIRAIVVCNFNKQESANGAKVFFVVKQFPFFPVLSVIVARFVD